jgi:hypothetical protein
MAVAPARLRMPLIHLGLGAIAVDSFLLGLPRWPLLGLLAVAFAIYLRVGTVRRPRWRWPCRSRAAGWPGTARSTGCQATTCTPTGRPTPSTWSTPRPTGGAPGSRGGPWPGVPRTSRVRPAGPGPGRRHCGAGARPRARPLEPHLPAGHAAPGARGDGPRAARTRADPRQPRGARPGRRGLRRPRASRCRWSGHGVGLVQLPGAPGRPTSATRWAAAGPRGTGPGRSPPTPWSGRGRPGSGSAARRRSGRAVLLEQRRPPVPAARQQPQAVDGHDRGPARLVGPLALGELVLGARRWPAFSRVWCAGRSRRGTAGGSRGRRR